MPVNITELLSKATKVSKVTEGNTAGGSSKMSFSVVYNRNGKRITISKKLAEALKLIDTAQLSFVIDAGVILLGKVTSQNKDERIELALKDERNTIQGGVTGKKISYNADAAHGIATGFNLDYSKKSSISFDKIEIDSSDAENPIAVITIKEVENVEEK